MAWLDVLHPGVQLRPCSCLGERLALVPSRTQAQVREGVTAPEGYPRLPETPAEEHSVVQFVRRSVVAIHAVIGFDLIGIIGGSSPEPATRVEENGGDAGTRERKLIAAEEEALIRLVVRRHRHSFAGGRCAQQP